MGVLDVLTDPIKDGIDWIEDTAKDIWHNPVDGIVGLGEDITKGTLGVVTLGQSNKYDTSYWIPDGPQINQVFEDRKVTVRDNLAPKEIVYGRVKKGGRVVYIEAAGDNSEELHLVIVLASHPCESINVVYFGDEIVANFSAKHLNDSQLFNIATDYQGSLGMYAQLGAHTTAFGAITGSTPPNWTDSHILTGHCYLWLTLTYNKDLYRQGIPSITVIMDGKNDIYDPRTDTSGYTNNHALCCLDYLRSPKGMNIPDGEINMQSFSDGADHADDSLETYSGGSNEPRYICQGVISVGNRPIDNIEEMQKAGAAFISKNQSGWKYIRAEYVVPALTLTEDDLIGGVRYTPSSGKQGRINTVKGVYVSGQNDWTTTDYPQINIPAYEADDLESLTGDIDYNFVTSPYQAQRLGKIAIERSRYGIKLDAVFKFKAIELEPGDRVTLNLPQVGINFVSFIVVGVGLSFQGGVSLSLVQDASAIYTDDPDDRKAVVPIPAITLPDPNPVAPSNIVISEELYSTNGGKDVKARAVVSWDEPAGRTQYYDVQFKLSSDTDWSTVENSVSGGSARKDDLAPETYDFRIRAINGLGWVGDWTTISNTAFQGKTAPPPDIDILTITNGVLDWDYSSAPLDLAGFVVRMNAGTSTDWSIAVPLHTGLVSDSRFSVSDILTAQSTFLVKAIDTSGIYSQNAVALTADPQSTGSVNWDDILGRPNEDQILNSLVDRTGWVLGATLPPADWSIQGDSNENVFEMDEGPYGQQEITWKATQVGGGSEDGGFYTNWADADDNKAYRFSVWVKWETTPTSYTYFQAQGQNSNLLSLAGSAGTANFVVAENTFTLNKWYLLVGYVHPKDTPLTTNTELSGVYNPDSGQRIFAGDDYKMGLFTQGVRLGIYQFFSSSSSVQRFCRPRIDIVDGDELSLSQLLLGDHITELLNNQQQWDEIQGSDKPEDNATNTTDTNQLNDGANLGGTSDWSGVNDDGGKPEDNADVTASNTSNDTSNVGSIDAKVIRSSAALVFRNSVEGDEFGDWTAGTATSITSSNDAHSSVQSLLIADTGMTSDAISEKVTIPIPEEIIMSFSGRRVRVALLIKQPTASDTQFMSVALITPDTPAAGTGAWANDIYMPDYSSYGRATKDYHVNDLPTAGNYYIGIDPDRSKSGKSIIIDSLLVFPLTDSEDINYEEVTSAPVFLNINSSGTLVNGPSGITTSKVSTGRYRVTHNSGYSGRGILLSHRSSNIGRHDIHSETSTKFEYQFFDTSGTLTDATATLLIDRNYLA